MRNFLRSMLVLGCVILLTTCDLFNPGLGKNVDINPPLLFVTSHANGDYVSGNITITGNFEEDVATASVEVSFDNGATYVPATLDQSARTWSLAVDTTAIPDGALDVRFRITDTSNKVTDKKILFYIDNTQPLVIMTVPSVYSGSAVYYGSLFQVKGETFDTFGVENVTVEIWNSDMSSRHVSLPATGTANWLVSFNSQTYVPTSGTLNFVIIATDKAGNTNTKYYHYWDIYRENLYSPIAIDEIYQYFIGAAGHDSGDVYDWLNDHGDTPIDLFFNQDQNKPTIEIYNPSQYQSLAQNVLTSTSRISGKAIDPDSVAAGSVQFRITDFSDVIITDWTSTGNELSPSLNWSYVLDGTLTDGTYKLYVRATDTGGNTKDDHPFVPFTIDTGAPTLTVAQPTQGQYLNGNFTVSGLAVDGSGIASVEVSTNDGATYNPASVTPLGGDTYSYTYSVNSPDEGSMLLKVRATDTTPKSTVYNLQVIVDTTPPTVNFLTPALSATVNGQVIFRGASSDNSQITLVELKVGKNDPFINLSGTYNWEYTIDSTSYANDTHAVETPLDSDVWKLEVRARATDVANNVTEITTYYIFVDNDTDKPVVNIIAPTNGQNLAGPVLVTGSAVDDDAVDHVEMQIDLNGDGDFLDAIDIGNGASKTLDSDTNDRFENEATWYTVTGTTVWQETLNQYGELYARTDTNPDLTGTINIRVRAVDINAVPVYGNYQQISVTLDDLIPRFESLSHVSGDYVKGSFNITGHAYDDATSGSSIASIWLSVNGGVTYTNIFGTSQVARVTDQHYTLNIPITTSGTGIGYYRLKVVDSANLQSIQYINLNIDNTFPSGTWDSISADPNDLRTTTADVRGTATDTGTVNGIAKIEVYFVRAGLVYNPRTGATTGVGSFDFGDGDGSVPYTANAAYKIVIDNRYEEGNDGGANGDGDGINESLTIGSGLTYDWWAEFNSTLITDGTITIHYVVFDQGGNGNHYTLGGTIANDKPVISAVTVGYDVDNSGAVQAGERFTYLSVFEATHRLYFQIAATDVNTPLTYEVLRNGTGANLISAGNSTEFSIAAEPEGSLYYLCRVTDSTGVSSYVNVQVTVENDDTADPSITVIDLTQDDVVDGHIELQDESLHDGADPDVSGTITVRGSAFDSRAINLITLTVSGLGTDVHMAEWSTVNGRLESVNADFTITTQAFNQTGHSIFWTYTWDSSSIANVAQDDVPFVPEDTDFAAHTGADNTFTVDVVPYVSGLLRSIGSEGTTRSKYGKYSINNSETGLQINGYNLAKTGTNWVRVYNTAGSASDEVTTAYVTANGSFTTLTISNLSDITHSGVLRIMVNGIEATNNINDNTKNNNKEDDGSGLASTLWRDDRYLQVWQVGSSFGDTGESANGEYPSMSIGSTGTLYGAWVMRANSRIYTATPGAAASSRYYCYDPPEFSDIFITGTGDITLGYLANQFAGDWGATNLGAVAVWSSTSTPPTQTSLTYTNYYHEFEGINHDQMLLQFQRPRVARSGNNIHVAYYDIDTSSVKYGYVLSTNTGGAEITPWVNLDGGSDGNDAQILTNALDGTPNRSGSAGEYVAVAVDEQGYPVVLYYDIANQTLRLARSTSLTPNAAGSWARQEVFQTGDANKQYSGKYVDMKFDTNGNLYVVCYNTANGDLVYLYAPDADGTDYAFTTSVKIDTVGAVGAWADISLNGTTPYVSYLNSSMVGTFSGLKVAYYDTTRSAWEYSTAAINTPIQDARTNIEYAKGAVTWTCAVGYKGTNFDIVYLRPEE